jgi:hypothetical protein
MLLGLAILGLAGLAIIGAMTASHRFTIMSFTIEGAGVSALGELVMRGEPSHVEFVMNRALVYFAAIAALAFSLPFPLCAQIRMRPVAVLIMLIPALLVLGASIDLATPPKKIPGMSKFESVVVPARRSSIRIVPILDGGNSAGMRVSGWRPEQNNSNAILIFLVAVVSGYSAVALLNKLRLSF